MVSEILKLCMGKGFLLDKEMLGLLESLTFDGAKNVIEALANLGVEERVLTKRLFMEKFDNLKHLLMMGKGEDEVKGFFKAMGYVEPKVVEEVKNGSVKVISSKSFEPRKISVSDFVTHYRSRYEVLKGVLESHEFDDLTSLRKLGFERGNYSVIVGIVDKRITKNKNLLLEVEDMTGNSVVLVNQNRPELFKKASELLLDDVVAFKVSGNKDMLFADDLIFPEAKLEEKKVCEIDEYVAFSGDFHAGSTMFLEENLRRFVKWLNGLEGNEEDRDLAMKVRYLFLLGDNIDGVGHYPGQEKHLDERTTVGQYKKVVDILKLVRDDVQIIMCTGQHDAVWVGEPQPAVPKKYVSDLYGMENVHLVSNPAMVEVDGGFRVLMYHGASINRIIDEIPEIRTKFGHMNPTKAVGEMVKRRHLAPMHGLMDYIPCEKDPLVISEVPDIIATADQHRAEFSEKNNILLVTSSCWQSMTPFEEKVGNVPDPCKVPLFNLKTREKKILDFSGEEIGVSNEK